LNVLVILPSLPSLSAKTTDFTGITTGRDGLGEDKNREGGI